MTDDELLEGFEACTLGGLHHADHVRLTWLYLRRLGLLATLPRLTAGLARFAESKGRADRYHETLTWAYVVLIHERMAQLGPDHSFEELVADSPDLMDWRNPIVHRYYDRSTLDSDLARRVFVLPRPARQS